MPRVWRTLPPPPPGFAADIGLPPFQARLLYNRGIRRRSDVQPYLAAGESLRHDPALLPDMDRAVTRLRKALRSGERIGVFGDFDADGITGTALLARALNRLGGTTICYLPHRVHEGHGLNETAVRVLRDRGVSLLVTVDCGATSVEEIDLAASLGIDTIVTDHHALLGDPPAAYALIDPMRIDSSYPYPHLTGVGMSFKLVEALYTHLGKSVPLHLLELAALGTVADVAPLTGENRYIVRRGLEYLNATQSPGIRALAAGAGLTPGKLDTGSLSFGLIPRLNVAGRLSHASLSLDLLMADSMADAEPLAAELELMNSKRRRLTEQAVREAQRKVDQRAESGEVPPLIVVASRDWHPGILGLIAGKLTDRYYRPAVAVSIAGELGRASARSIPEFNIVDALRQCRELFVRFGGHSRAAGFTVHTPLLPQVERRLVEEAERRLRGMDLRPLITIDCEIPLASIAGDGFRSVQSLSPVGEGNPDPVFLTRGASVVDLRRVGSLGQHLKMRLRHGGAVWNSIAFGHGDRGVSVGQAIDVVYTVGLNDWRGESSLELTVLDFR